MKNKVLHSLLYLLYLALLLSMLCAFRAISSIGIAVLLVTAFITNRSEHHSIFRTGPVTWYLVACTLFFLLQVTGLLYTDHPKEGWKHVQLKSSILFIPLCFYVYRFINTNRLHRLMTHFTWLLITASLYCLIAAINTYQHAGTSIFFYHNLVLPFRHHAVHYSIMVFAAFIFLVETAHTRQYLINRFVHVAIMGFLIGFLLLLSSKLVIVFMAGYLLLFLFYTVKNNIPGRYFAVTIALTGLLFIGLVVCSPNPVSRRFQDMLHGNIHLIQQPSFSPANYFNALQFRLLQWRFTAEIVREQKAWFKGVSPGDAQLMLDQKYITTHMYTGQAGRPDKGYVGFNTHNQFLESLLQNGIPGLLCFVAICVAMVAMAIKQKNRPFSTLVALLIAYAFTESVFETQYGIMLFILLPLLYYYGSQPS